MVSRESDVLLISLENIVGLTDPLVKATPVFFTHVFHLFKSENSSQSLACRLVGGTHSEICLKMIYNHSRFSQKINRS